MRRGRGRPKSILSKNNRINIRLSDFERSMLEKMCVDFDQSASDVVRDALDLYYKQTHFTELDVEELI